MRRKIPPQNIIYVNFEDDRLYPLKGDELRSLPEVYFEYFSPDENSPVWFLLDKIQNIPNWERSTRTFLVFEVPLFSYTAKDRLRYPRKVYAIDTGLVNSITFRHSHNYGRMLENVVFLLV